jgi:glutathione S-transferase
LALTYDVDVPLDFPGVRQWFKRMAAHPAFVSASPERVRNILVEFD